MNTTETKKLIQDYLGQIKMMHLATIFEGKPWTCNVWFATDEDLNFYWLSSTKVRHSQALLTDKDVAAAIWLQQGPEDMPVQGIQIEGTAEILTDQAEIEKAIKCYSERIFGIDQIKQFMASPYEPRRFYRLKPSKIMLLDTSTAVDNNPYHEYTPAK